MLLGTQTINDAGHLTIGGCDATELAAEFGTPLYVVDEALIRANCRGYREAFEKRYPKNRICYASKAFLTPALCRVIEEEGLDIDVASAGELYTALKAGFPSRQIHVHGNNKSVDEIEMAVARKVGDIIVDNSLEIERLAACAAKARRKVDVLVRVAPGVDPNTHRFISTGQADTKFGFNIKDGSALAAVKQVLAAPSLVFRGIHFHVGSQLLDTESHEGAIDAAVALISTIRQECGVTCEVLNIGGGLGVRYREHHQPPTLDEFAEATVSRLKAALDARQLPYPVLQQEPGRSIVGEAGTTLYTAGAIKTVPIVEEPGTRTYVAVDGGLSDNPRPQLYDAEYEVLVANRAGEPRDRVVSIAGKHCETDILVWNARVQSIEPGDILAVQTTGAYNHAMASNYNRLPRPAVVFVKDGQADLVVARETYADLVRRERIPARLAQTRTPAR